LCPGSVCGASKAGVRLVCAIRRRSGPGTTTCPRPARAGLLMRRTHTPIPNQVKALAPPVPPPCARFPHTPFGTAETAETAETGATTGAPAATRTAQANAPLEFCRNPRMSPPAQPSRQPGILARRPDQIKEIFPIMLPPPRKANRRACVDGPSDARGKGRIF